MEEWEHSALVSIVDLLCDPQQDLAEARGSAKTLPTLCSRQCLLIVFLDRHFAPSSLLPFLASLAAVTLSACSLIGNRWL